MMIWIHIVANLIMIALDVAWWVFALCLAKRTLWRVLVSAFMAIQLFAILNELAGRLGILGMDLTHVPTVFLAANMIWHNLVLPFFSLFGFIYVCLKLLQRQRAKAAKPELPADASKASNPVSRREFIGACAALAPPLLTFSLAGIAMRQLSHFRLRRFTLSLPSLPRQLDGVTIANVSDIHVGEWTHGQVLRDIVNTTNSLRADVVVLTGDLINYELSDLSGALDLVKAMPGRYGTWMVEGNHDLLQNGLEFEQRVKISGVPLLLDESAVATVRGYPIQFFGLRWMDCVGHRLDRVTAFQMQSVLRQRHPDAFPIVLAHHPHVFDAAVEANMPLTLTGHTHGGQLMLTKDIGVGPTLFRYWSGFYQRNQSQLIVSNGVGNTFPLRIDAPAEIVHITLRCA
jgi:uncharacterized protein